MHDSCIKRRGYILAIGLNYAVKLMSVSCRTWKGTTGRWELPSKLFQRYRNSTYA
jgi:hypothetical protein